MVRTYAHNPSTEGNFFGSSSTPFLNELPSTTQEVHVNDVEIMPVRQQAPPPERCNCNAVSQPFYTPFHSPYVDPVGSIIGLRVLYLEGKLCYVPVEPQLNYIINQQFANGFCTHRMGNESLPTNEDVKRISHYEVFKDNLSRVQSPYQTFSSQKQPQYSPSQSVSTPVLATVTQKPHQKDEIQDDPPWMMSHPQPRSGVRRSRLWRGEEAIVQETGFSPARPISRSRAISLDKINSLSRTDPHSHKSYISTEEQHKQELLKQMEENKRRRELEKQKEKEEEEREIRRFERYNEKIRQEEEEERRKQREKAKMMERRSQEVHESNNRRRNSRRNSSPPPKERKNSASLSEEQHLEWWEKKPAWQQRLEEEGRRSAVIPKMRDKPLHTPTPDRRTQSRHITNSYDPAASVERHQSAGQRSSRLSQRSDKDYGGPSSPGDSQKRSSSRSSRRSNAQRLPTSSSANQYLQESYEKEIAGNAGNVARDPHGRPTSFTIM